jgi:hypothetical protein
MTNTVGAIVINANKKQSGKNKYMEINEIFEKLKTIYVENGFKEKTLTFNEGNDLLHPSISFSYNKVNYIIYIENEDEFYCTIDSIDDTDLDDDFYMYLNEYDETNEPIEYFDQYLINIKEGIHSKIRKVWIELEKIKEKYESDDDINYLFNMIAKRALDLD